jgi:iduronate 2-sulfatase
MKRNTGQVAGLAAQPKNRNMHNFVSPILTALLLTPLAVPHAAEHRTNVLFVVVDDLNTELGCYGNRVVKSPNIDRLAARGVRFDRAYCQYALCAPSRASFLSGRRPETTGIYAAKLAPRKAMPDAIMLPQLFRQNGYFCLGAGKVYHSTGHNDPKSWDVYQDGDGEDAQEKAALTARYGGEDRVPRWYVLDGDGSKTRDGLNVRLIASRLTDHAKSGKPFFLAMGFHKPHLPWTAPKRFFDLYPTASLPLPKSPPMNKVPEIALQTELSRVDQPESRAGAVAAYYACISFTDDNLGLLLDTLDRHHLWENTVVVLLGDNGFHLGDHGGLWAKHSLFENATRIPLIFAGAGVPRAKVVARPVELLDVYPTLADLTGLKAPPGLEGKSLLPLMKSDTSEPGAHAFSMIYHYDAATDTDVVGRSVQTATCRYTEWANARSDREIYFSDSDPGACNNRIGDPAVRAAQANAAQRLRELKMPKPGPVTRSRGLGNNLEDKK